MNITIVQTFTDGFTTYQSGQELSVPSEVAQRWIADGKAQADTDGQQSWLSSTEVAATRALVSGGGNRLAVAMGVIGQSLPLGACQINDALGVKTRVGFSAPSQGYVEGVKTNLAPGQHGSYVTLLIQKLANELRIFHENGCIGGSSLTLDYLGVLDVSGWRANRAYRGARVADTANGDPGHKGEFILENGAWWECTTGCDHLAFYNSDTPKTVEAIAWRRNITYIAKNTNRTSANAKPTFTPGTPDVTTVTDNGTGSTGGGVVWTQRTAGANNTADGAGTIDGVSRNQRVMRLTDSGYDPYGALARIRTAILGMPVSANNRYCLVVGTVQTDAGKESALIAKGMQLVGSSLAADGIKPIYTGCMYYPTSGTANYDTHETAMTGAGIAGTPNYSVNPLQVLLTGSSGYTLGIPGTTPRTGVVYYIIPSLYRLLGTNILSLLQTPQPDPHATPEGCDACATALAPYVRAVLLNVAAPAYP